MDATLRCRSRPRCRRDIRRSGAFIRQIARELGRGESGLRHLLKTLDASPLDLDLAGITRFFTNELVRRVQSAASPSPELPRKTTGTRPAVSAGEVADLICNWLPQTKLNRPSCAEIIKQVRRKLNELKDAGLSPDTSMLL
jgi:hypothetical protein